MNYLKECSESTRMPVKLAKKKKTPLVIKLLKGEAFIDDRASMLQAVITELNGKGYTIEEEYDFGVTFIKDDHLVLVAEHTTYVAGYCYYLPDDGFATLTIITVSDRVNTATFTKESANQVVIDLTQRKRIYTIGSHCEDCPFEYECSGVTSAAINSISKIKGYVEDPAPDEYNIADSYNDYVVAKKAVDAFKKILDNEIKKHGVVSNDSITICKVRQERLSIPAFAAVKHMANKFPDATELLKDVTITKGAIEKFVKSKAETGDKQNSADIMIQELKDNGLVEIDETFVIEVTPNESINK